MLLCHSGKLQCCSHYRSRLWLTARKPHEVTAALMLRYVCDKALILLIHAPSCQAWTDATPKALFSTSSRQRRSDRTPFFYSLAARGSGSRRTGFFFFHVVTASSELDFHEPLQFIRYVVHIAANNISRLCRSGLCSTAQMHSNRTPMLLQVAGLLSGDLHECHGSNPKDTSQLRHRFVTN
jgi:hypothetical protein